MAVIDLTSATAAEMFVARLELPDVDPPIIQYLNETDPETEDDPPLGWTDLVTLTPDSYDWDLVEVANPAVGKPFYRMRIIDTEGVDDFLKTAEAVLYANNRYKLSRERPPFGATKIWTLRLELMDEEVA